MKRDESQNAPAGGIVGKKATMKLLKGFDYRKPYFYMVTLKRLVGLLAFSQITEDADPPKDAKGWPCYLIANEITRAFAAKWRGLAPIDCFVIMPDHIHLLIRILDTGDQLPLGSYVHQLMRTLAFEYWRVTGCPPQGSHGGERGGTGPAAQNPSVVRGTPAPRISPVFERDWHDWIVKKDGQLAAFTRYIRENPERAWLRRVNRRYCLHALHSREPGAGVAAARQPAVFRAGSQGLLSWAGMVRVWQHGHSRIAGSEGRERPSHNETRLCRMGCDGG